MPLNQNPALRGPLSEEINMPRNWREMTPRERQLEKLADYALAVLLAVLPALILFSSL